MRANPPIRGAVQKGIFPADGQPQAGLLGSPNASAFFGGISPLP